MKPWHIILVAGALGITLLFLAASAFLISTGAMQNNVHQSPNAGCPACWTAFHLDNIDNLTPRQKAAIARRCPVCGNLESVLVYEEIWRRAGK